MSRALIKTNCDITSNIEADTMIVDEGMLYIYKLTEADGELIGIFRLDNIEVAYLTKGGK